MLGGNLPENRELEKRLFSNAEVVRVNQEGDNPRQVVKADGRMVWVSDAADGAKYVGLFNISDSVKDVGIDLAVLGFRRAVVVRDLWQQQDLGIYKKQYHRMLAAHACTLLKIFPH